MDVDLIMKVAGVGMIVAVPVFATLLAVVRDVIDTHLRRSELPTDISEYYNNKRFVVAFQINQASLVTDILSDEATVPKMETSGKVRK